MPPDVNWLGSSRNKTKKDLGGIMDKEKFCKMFSKVLIFISSVLLIYGAYTYIFSNESLVLIMGIIVAIFTIIRAIARKKIMK